MYFGSLNMDVICNETINKVQFKQIEVSLNENVIAYRECLQY